MSDLFNVTVTVNGTRYERTVEPRMLLSDFLRHELGLTGTHVGCEHGVCGTCTVVSPGVTETEFQGVAGHAYTRYMRLTQMPSSEVARIGIEAMLSGKSAVIPGLHNAAFVASERFAPRRVVTALAGYFMRARR